MSKIEIIGCGERTVLTLLKKKYGTICEYRTQMMLKDMVSPNYVFTLSDRQMKETIDIVVYPLFNKPIAIRVQDKHHSTSRMSIIDDIQRYTLETNGYSIVDVWHYECVEIWKESVNDKSMKELEDSFLMEYVEHL